MLTAFWNFTKKQAILGTYMLEDSQIEINKIDLSQLKT